MKTTSRILGFSEGFHDAAAAVVEDGVVVFASHSERFSKIKNDKIICPELINYIDDRWKPDTIAFYEKTWKKRLRQLRAGQYKHAFRQRHYAWNYNQSFSHHLSHAAAAFQCSPYKEAYAVVIDAIGEFDTLTQWHCTYDENGNAFYDKMGSISYPMSLGLFYSAITDRVGLKPMEDEYILMGMAAYGSHKRNLYDGMRKLFKHNLHRGCKEFAPNETDENLAFNAQLLTENIIKTLIKKLPANLPIVYGGGVAHNIKANARVFGNRDHYIFPNPGDAGSSVGAAALAWRKKVEIPHMFLGHDVGKLTDEQVKLTVDHILKEGIIGVCAEAAEFGPRALGNRSLLADPRDSSVKDKVNDIKKRQKFRPFAPSILAEHRKIYFEYSDKDYDYMQYTAKCLQQIKIPSVVHADGSSRVHTVNKNTADVSPLRNILECWYEKTGCPVLLNTSLNIKGMPIVNNIEDAQDFERMYKTKVMTPNG